MSKSQKKNSRSVWALLRDQRLGLQHDNRVIENHPLAKMYPPALTSLDALACLEANHGRPGQFSSEIKVLDLDRCEQERAKQQKTALGATADAVAGIAKNSVLLIELKLGAASAVSLIPNKIIQKFEYSCNLLRHEKYAGGIYPKLLLVLPDVKHNQVTRRNLWSMMVGSAKLRELCAVTTPQGFAGNLS